jgi:hypothetical protein
VSARRALLISAIAVAALVHCGGKAPPAVERAPLDDGAVARVGDVAIPPSLVAAVAGAQGLSAREALDELVGDALAAQGASARGFAAVPSVAWAQTTALARGIPSRFADEASRAGPPSDDELASVLVVQAVVLRSPTLREEDALALARTTRQAVAGARSADEFVKRANSVPRSNATLIAQTVGPFAADGIDPSGAELDAGFVAAAFALRTPFDPSPIVATPFGWHVLELVERKTPASAAEAEAQRGAHAGAVRNVRSRMRLEALLRVLRSNGHVETDPAADDLMARATASP